MDSVFFQKVIVFIGLLQKGEWSNPLSAETTLRSPCLRGEKNNHRDAEDTERKKKNTWCPLCLRGEKNNYIDAEYIDRKKIHRALCASVVNKKTS
jgi:hypothetical protein